MLQSQIEWTIKNNKLLYRKCMQKKVYKCVEVHPTLYNNMCVEVHPTMYNNIYSTANSVQ